MKVHAAFKVKADEGNKEGAIRWHYHTTFEGWYVVISHHDDLSRAIVQEYFCTYYDTYGAGRTILRFERETGPRFEIRTCRSFSLVCLYSYVAWVTNALVEARPNFDFEEVNAELVLGAVYLWGDNLCSMMCLNMKIAAIIKMWMCWKQSSRCAGTGIWIQIQALWQVVVVGVESTMF